MPHYIAITVPADPDADNCFEAAIADYLDDHPEADGYTIDAVWGDADRKTVELTVPVIHEN